MDKILEGFKPADLPVQQATKFEFIINPTAAKQIGLTTSKAAAQRYGTTEEDLKRRRPRRSHRSANRVGQAPRVLAKGLTLSVFSYMEELQRPVHAGVRNQEELSRRLSQNHGTKITEK